MEINAAAFVKKFELLPHPEGGYYKETYRSSELLAADALPARFAGVRAMATAIYFLLERNNFSAFHRIKSDECWHFYAGDCLHIQVLLPTGQYQLIKLGNNPMAGEKFQAIVPAGAWFASETAIEGSFSFVGCTVAPGFDFADFELAKAENLISIFPDHATLINRLCRV
jgi:predicted cupin superfamily sugar epimerase